MFKPLPTHDRLIYLLDYNPLTGELRWKHTSRRMKEGYLAGYLARDGYRCISVDGSFFKAHRLAWKIMHKDWDEVKTIDHINRFRFDNRICNLRLATTKEQGANTCRSRIIVHNGISHTITDWSLKLSRDRNLVHCRLRDGWTEEDAVTIPAGPSGNRYSS